MTTGIIKKENGRTSMPSTSFSGLVDQIFQNNLNRFFEEDPWGFNTSYRTNVPVNLQETDSTYELQLVAPGLKKEDFRISVEGDMLTVSFEHREENKQEDNKRQWLRKEYRQQSFTRSFNLDDSLDANKVTAEYKDGVLHLTLPKKEGKQRVAKKIEIK